MKKDNEGFTCLHYAVFRGNYKMAVLFEKNGADIYQINHQGLTVLHIAAQGDSPLLMVIFFLFSITTSIKDSKLGFKMPKEALPCIGPAIVDGKPAYAQACGNAITIRR